MNNIEMYLPEKSENAAKVGKILNIHANSLWLVGSAARKWLYKLKANTDDFDFVLDNNNGDYQDGIIQDFELAGFKIKEGAWGSPRGLHIDCDSFELKIRIEPVGSFLQAVAFAGDGLAINVASGRPICIPEYMNLPPMIPIRDDIQKDDPQLEDAWMKDHIDKLTVFQKEIEIQVHQLYEDASANK